MYRAMALKPKYYLRGNQMQNKRSKPDVEQEAKKSMMSGRRRTSIGTKLVANVNDQTIRCSEISTWLKEVEQTLHQMGWELKSVQKSSDIASGRNRKVVLHPIPDPFTNEREQKERAVRYHLVNVLRSVETPRNNATKKVLCLRR